MKLILTGLMVVFILLSQAAFSQENGPKNSDSQPEILVFVNYKNASPFFLLFSSHFEKALYAWWGEGGGRTKVAKGKWQVGVMEDSLRRSRFPVVIIIAGKKGEDGMMSLIPILNVKDENYLKSEASRVAQNMAAALLVRATEEKMKEPGRKK